MTITKPGAEIIVGNGSSRCLTASCDSVVSKPVQQGHNPSQVRTNALFFLNHDCYYYFLFIYINPWVFLFLHQIYLTRVKLCLFSGTHCIEMQLHSLFDQLIRPDVWTFARYWSLDLPAAPFIQFLFFICSAAGCFQFKKFFEPTVTVHVKFKLAYVVYIVT